MVISTVESSEDGAGDSALGGQYGLLVTVLWVGSALLVTSLWALMGKNDLDFTILIPINKRMYPF